jgi:hypothetical protein
MAGGPWSCRVWSRADIERLRDMAENLGFLSANQPGVYRRAKEINGRSIKL